MAEMGGKVTNCARFHEQMLDATSASLSGALLAAFDAHLCDCAACRDEFRRVQSSVQKIDQTLSVSLTAEPSAQLVANVRKNILQDINAQPHGAAAWRRWSAWATAAGVCAAFAILLFVARTSHKFNQPVRNSAVAQTSASPNSKLTAHPALNPPFDAASLSPHLRNPAFRLARHTSPRAPHAKAVEPEIIVEPGQMQAILQLVAATQRGQSNGANLLNIDKKAVEPLEIKPIVIAPLKIAPLDNEAAPASSKGEGGDKYFVAEHLN